MFGENLSVSTLLKKDLPHVAAIKCSCHMIHLCASHACLKLSTTLEDLCRNIYSHFSRSTLRQKDFTQFQEFVQAQPHKMLKLSQTRWLSLESCVTRILEQWKALRLYFIAFVADGKDPSYTTEYFERLEQQICACSIGVLKCTAAPSQRVQHHVPNDSTNATSSQRRSEKPAARYS